MCSGVKVLRHLGHGEHYTSARCYHCYLHEKVDLVFTLFCGFNNMRMFRLVYPPDFRSCYSRGQNG